MKELQELIDELHKWQRETFPQSSPISKLHHLAEEIPELIEEIEKHYHNSGDLKATELEYADCFILLLGSAFMYGLKAEDIFRIIREKLEINKSRIWGTPDENGVVKHIK